MRLTPEQAQTIRQHIGSHLGSHPQVWLFGSRVDFSLTQVEKFLPIHWKVPHEHQFSRLACNR